VVIDVISQVQWLLMKSYGVTAILCNMCRMKHLFAAESESADLLLFSSHI